MALRRPWGRGEVSGGGMAGRQLWKSIVAGALSGLFVTLTLAVAVTALLYNGVLWQYAYNSQIPVIQETAGMAALSDASRIPSFLLGWQPIAAALMAIGVGLALIERFAQRFPRAWRTRIASGSLLLFISAVVISKLISDAEQSLFDATDVSASVATLSERRDSVWGQVLMGAVVSFALAGSIWLYWSWWYRRLRGWLAAPPDPLASEQELLPTADRWFELRQQRQRMQRTIALVLAGCALALFGAEAAYEQARSTVVSGNLWVEPAAPTSSAKVTLSRPARNLVVENTYGSGAAAVTLLTPAGAQAAPPATLTLPENHISFERQSIPVDGLPQGTYQLSAKLDAGSGGRIGYALIESSGALTSALAVVVGLLMGAVVALGVLLLSFWAQKMGSE